MDDMETKKEKDFSIASLICGLLMWVPVFNSVLGPMAIILGILSIRRIKQEPSRYCGQGMAITGIVLGSISTIFLIVTLYIKIFKPELLIA